MIFGDKDQEVEQKLIQHISSIIAEKLIENLSPMKTILY
jgi:hypothetical protein